tara:strand:+ start:25 stop:498 length:474 start_codon:yes stop_codon:yes gene_type:complete
MKKFSLDLEGIKKFQQNREPYLMIDYVDEVIPGVSAKGYKNLKDDWFFKVHWPNDPNMPGMLQIESLVQMAALTVLTLPGNKGKIVYLVSATNLQFKKKIIPGDKLKINTYLKSWKRGLGQCTGEGYVNNDLACKAEFKIIMPEIIDNFSVQDNIKL